MPRQILTINKNDTSHSRLKPAPSVNDRCCPSVLGRLALTNLSYIHSTLEMEWNSWVVKSTLNCWKQQWCRSLVHGNTRKASCVQQSLPKASYYLKTHLRTITIGHNPQPYWPQEEKSTDHDPRQYPTFLWLVKLGCSFIFCNRKSTKKYSVVSILTVLRIWRRHKSRNKRSRLRTVLVKAVRQCWKANYLLQRWTKSFLVILSV